MYFRTCIYKLRIEKKKEILKYFFLNQLNLRLKYGTLKKKEKKTVVRTFN